MGWFILIGLSTFWIGWKLREITLLDGLPENARKEWEERRERLENREIDSDTGFHKDLGIKFHSMEEVR